MNLQFRTTVLRFMSIFIGQTRTGKANSRIGGLDKKPTKGLGHNLCRTLLRLLLKQHLEPFAQQRAALKRV